MASELIQINSLSKRFGHQERPAVDCLSLSVFRGEVFGFLGPNGAGKTTTIRMLLDLIRPTAGDARIFQLDTHSQSSAIHARVGYLPGDLNLYRRLNGHELLEYLAKLKGSVDWQYVDELVERLEVDLEKPLHDLSRGNRQKVGLVQACMSRPELLILDEPTSGLDPLKQREFRSIIRESADAGQTVFLSSHALDEVERVADRVAIIREGTLVVVEEVESLKERAIHRVEVTFSDEIPTDLFNRLEGVNDVSFDRKTAEFSISGSFEKLIGALSGQSVVNIVSREADLEEIFLSYYRGEREKS